MQSKPMLMDDLLDIRDQIKRLRISEAALMHELGFLSVPPDSQAPQIRNRRRRCFRLASLPDYVRNDPSWWTAISANYVVLSDGPRKGGEITLFE